MADLLEEYISSFRTQYKDAEKKLLNEDPKLESDLEELKDELRIIGMQLKAYKSKVITNFKNKKKKFLWSFLSLINLALQQNNVQNQIL